MKKVISAVLAFSMLFMLSACMAPGKEKEEENEQTQTLNYSSRLKGVWLSYYEIGDIFQKANESEAVQKLEEMFSDLAQRGINTVFFHVRAFADAFYDSSYFPLSRYAPKGYDLLKLAVQTAHNHQISLHAWINPYRVALNTKPDELNAESPAAVLYKENAKNLIFFDNGIYFNPASAAVQKLILNGIRELCEKYEIDGIHFDDYFYPTAEKNVDKTSYAAYKNAGGSLQPEDYRRENVTALICAVHILLEQINPHIVFGVSPQASLEKNREQLFADIQRWLNLEAVDYLMPQIYFGFENESSPFEKTLSEWLDLMKNKKAVLYCGLALYKSGKEDAYAGGDKADENAAFYEWVRENDIIARQVRLLNAKGVKGFCLYSYSSLAGGGSDEAAGKEVENLAPLLSGRIHVYR